MSACQPGNQYVWGLPPFPPSGSPDNACSSTSNVTSPWPDSVTTMGGERGIFSELDCARVCETTKKETKRSKFLAISKSNYIHKSCLELAKCFSPCFPDSWYGRTLQILLIKFGSIYKCKSNKTTKGEIFKSFLSILTLKAQGIKMPERKVIKLDDTGER